MEIDNLKSVWQEISTPQKNREELNLMLKKYSFPMLRSIKKQLIIETASFTAFLLCYFSMFDGAEKPLVVNLIIIIAVALQIFYGYKGYLLQSQFRGSTNLNNDLESFATKLKSYRMEVMLARIIFAVAILIFFSYGVNFSANKFWALSFIIVIFSVQLGLFYRIWTKRINRLELVLEDFKTSIT